MNALPEPGDYAPIINALMNGNYFLSSGEVLIPSHQYSGSGANASLTVDVEWTFPLDFVEVVTGDGERTTRRPRAQGDRRAPARRAGRRASGSCR
jgi:hypothetical protein